ncbi:MAG: Holliday junction branch migration protein RuvA [bacterium]
MIGYLKGQVLAIASESIILDVQGVGYEVNTMPRALSHLQQGQAISLFIETIVREDFIRLYGFESSTEQHCFRLLQTVQGVGAKAALAVLQVLSPSQLLEAITLADDASISRAQGVGKKIATRIATELKGKIPDLAALIGAHGSLKEVSDDTSLSSPTPPSGLTSASKDESALIIQDTVSALSNLGYDPIEARRAATLSLKNNPDHSVEDLIVVALKELAVL